jgi:undecaprenyl pyrophosphate phosphatase UppP
MSSSRFDFVSDGVTRVHLERAFVLVIALVTVSETPQYSDEIKSSFRKTAIIHTASIIEALLLLILKSRKTENDCGESKDVVDKKLYKNRLKMS